MQFEVIIASGQHMNIEVDDVRTLDGYIDRAVIVDAKPDGYRGERHWRVNCAHIGAYRADETATEVVPDGD